MSLTQRINPREEALVFARGRRIYVWAYDKPQSIAVRPGIVHTLRVHNGRLVDSGKYDGVRDTLTGEIIMGGGMRWSHLAESEGRLVGDGEYINFSQGEGIRDARTGEVLWRYNGKTTMLANVPFLINAGDYREFREDYNHEESWRIPRFFDKYSYRGRIIWTYDFSHDCFAWHRFENEVLRRKYVQAIYDTKKHQALADSNVFDRERAAIEHDGRILISSGSEVLALDESEKDGIYRPRRFFQSRFGGLDKLRKTLFDFYYHYRELREWSDDNLRKKKEIWGKFCDFLEDNYDKLPRKSKIFSVGDVCRQRIATKVIRPMSFEKACKEYEEPLLMAHTWMKKHSYRPLAGNAEQGEFLTPVIETVHDTLFYSSGQENEIRAMACVNNSLLVGGRRIEEAREEMDSKEELEARVLQLPLVHPTSSFIEAMTAVPIDVYDDGIKQAVLRGIRNRAVHARRGRRVVLLAA